MKMGVKSLLFLFVILASLSVACEQSVFSVEKISEDEYMQAESTSVDYNIYPQRIDSIAYSATINKIFQDAKERIARMDSLSRCAIYEAVTDEELFCVDNLLYFPQMNLLGFMMPISNFNSDMLWYDSTTGSFVDNTRFVPTAVNKNGIFVCQVDGDCDIMLNLHFFEKRGNLIYEIQTYKNYNYSGEQSLFVAEGEHYKTIFWHKDGTLYLCSFDYSKNETAYLKISLN